MRRYVDSALDALRGAQGLLSVNLTSKQAAALLQHIAALEQRVEAMRGLLYDGHAVFTALSANARRRTSPENVSDVLDALVVAYRASLPEAAQLERDDIDASFKAFRELVREQQEYERAQLTAAQGALDAANQHVQILLVQQEEYGHERTTAQQTIDRMRAKLLELAGECAECGGSGLVTIRGMCGGVEMDCDDQPCPECLDIREAAR